ncbi:MAG: hypothetical protein PSV13_12805 [Lacunisphaera sp.]|nr:hypothetical protein [Lacunisphaera sp.]
MIRLALALALLLLVSLPVAAAPAPHVDDAGGLLPAGSPWAQGLESKLVSFERTAGIRVLIRLQLKSPTAVEDKVPGAYMRDLANKLGVIRDGVLVVYFADDPDWRVWIGDELTPRFMGRAGTAEEFTASGAMHETKEAMLQECLDQAEATLAWLKRAAPKQTPPVGLKIVLQADALADGLIRRLKPRHAAR